MKAITQINILHKNQGKLRLFTFWCLAQVTGCAQIFIGTSLLWGHSGYYGIVQNKLWAPAAILLCLGPITFVLCWMGCQATNQRKRCLLGMVSASQLIRILLKKTSIMV